MSCRSSDLGTGMREPIRVLCSAADCLKRDNSGFFLLNLRSLLPSILNPGTKHCKLSLSIHKDEVPGMRAKAHCRRFVTKIETKMKAREVKIFSVSELSEAFHVRPYISNEA